MAELAGDRTIARLVADRSAEYAALAEQVTSAELVAGVAAVAEVFVDVYRAGGQVLAFGNGGSAADAAHLAAEFVGRCTKDRRPLPALALGDSTAAVTALANDYGYEEVFVRQLAAHGRPGDLAVALTTSGRSPSVLRGLVSARAMGLRTVAFTGRSGAALVSADLVLAVPSDHTGRIQEVHQLWAHVCAEVVELALFG